MAANEDTPTAAELLNADVLMFDEPTGHSDVSDMNDRIGGDFPGQHHVYLQGHKWQLRDTVVENIQRRRHISKSARAMAVTFLEQGHWKA